jgi:YD repeat-containing protein
MGPGLAVPQAPQIPGGPEEVPTAQADFAASPGLWVSLNKMGIPFVVHRDTSVPTRAGPLDFTRLKVPPYEIMDCWPTAFGNGGWTHSQHHYIHYHEYWGGSNLVRCDGLRCQEGCYWDNGDGTWSPPPGCHNKLIEIPTGFKLTTKDRHTYWYTVYEPLSVPRYHLSSVTDRYGNVFSYSYDGSSRLTSATGPGGETLTLAYDGNGRLTSATDSAGRQWHYQYGSASGRTVLISASTQVRTSSGLQTVTTVYEYLPDATNDGAAWVTAIVDPEGNATRIAYTTLPGFHQGESSGWDEYAVRKVVDSLENETTYFYDGTWLSSLWRTCVTDPKGRSRVYVAPNSGNYVVYTQDDSGNVTTLDFDADRNIVRIVDKNGSETRMGYDGDGNRVSVTRVLRGGDNVAYDPSGDPLTCDESKEITATTYYTYEPDFNQVATVVDPLGRVTTKTCDGNGNLIKTVDPLGNTTEYSYDSYGQRVSTTDARGSTWKYEYDTHGNLTKTTDPLEHSTTAEYDIAGNKIKETDSLGRSTTYEYDELNRLRKATFSDGNSETRTYDRNGPLLTITDAEGNTTTYTYTPLWQLASVETALDETTSYDYDEVGNRTKMTDALNRETTYDYDDLYRLTKITYPGSKTEEFTCDAEGNVLTKKDRSGKTTTFTYDAFKRPVKVQGPAQ